MANWANHNQTHFNVGDTIDVHYKLIEKEKVSGKAKKETKEEIRERIQIFSGIVIKIKGEKENKSFTVRKIGVGAIGIERIFPLSSPWVKKIVIKKKGSVKRAKLYYLREKIGREADRLKEKSGKKGEIVEEKKEITEKSAEKAATELPQNEDKK